MGYDVYGNAGNYFGANLRGWSGFCDAMTLAGFDVPWSWTNNDGAGLTEQAECDRLADLLAAWLPSWDGRTLIRKLDVTPIEHADIEEWIVFLRECGGFAIR